MNQEIRLLSLWQPWASLIPAGLKKYETRSWETKYRGLIAIHATQRCVAAGEVLQILKKCPEIEDKLPRGMAWFSGLPLGYIVAIATVTDCLRMIDTQIADPHQSTQGCIYLEAQSQTERAVGDWTHGRYAWKLQNILALPEPTPFRGAQGLRRLDEDTIGQIEQRLGLGSVKPEQRSTPAKEQLDLFC